MPKISNPEHLSSSYNKTIQWFLSLFLPLSITLSLSPFCLNRLSRQWKICLSLYHYTRRIEERIEIVVDWDEAGRDVQPCGNAKTRYCAPQNVTWDVTRRLSLLSTATADGSSRQNSLELLNSDRPRCTDTQVVKLSLVRWAGWPVKKALLQNVSLYGRREAVEQHINRLLFSSSIHRPST